MESVQESDKFTDGHATARINNSSIIGGESLIMNRTAANYGAKLKTGNKIIEPRDMFP